MARNAYRDGERAYARLYFDNPYLYEPNRSEWDRGFHDAMEAREALDKAEKQRRDDLWNVPRDARDAYIRMEDNFSPQTVLEFMIDMLESGKQGEE